jgi:hypothetical protein
MKYFSSGFLFTSGCITALLFLWLVIQMFIRLKVQEIYYHGQPCVLQVYMPTEWGEQKPYSPFCLLDVWRLQRAHREKLHSEWSVATHEGAV